MLRHHWRVTSCYGVCDLFIRKSSNLGAIKPTRTGIYPYSNKNGGTYSEGPACQVRRATLDYPSCFGGRDKRAPPTGHDEHAPPIPALATLVQATRRVFAVADQGVSWLRHRQ